MGSGSVNSKKVFKGGEMGREGRVAARMAMNMIVGAKLLSLLLKGNLRRQRPMLLHIDEQICRGKSLFIYLIILSLSCMLRCRRSGNILFQQFRPSLRIP